MKIKSKVRYQTSAGECWLADCRRVMKLMEPGSVDLVFADLPYGTTACKWDSIIPFDELWEGLHRVCGPGTPMIFTASNPFTSALVMSNPKEFKLEWIWDKVTASGHLHAKHGPMKQHESVLLFSRSGQAVAYNPQMVPLPAGAVAAYRGETKRGALYHGKKTMSAELKVREFLYPKTIQSFSNANRKGRLNPTQKPVPLVEYFIKTYSDRGALVFDPTFGSGTTAIAARNLGRRFVGCENDPAMFFKAIERIDGE